MNCSLPAFAKQAIGLLFLLLLSSTKLALANSQTITISGNVVDTQGRVLDYVRVNVIKNDGSYYYAAQEITDDNGYFEARVPKGEYQLNLELHQSIYDEQNKRTFFTTYPVPDYASITYQFKQDVLEVDTQVEIELPLVTLSGTLHDEQKKPVAGANLLISQTYHNVDSRLRRIYWNNYAGNTNAPSATDQNGNFEFAVVANQDIELFAAPQENSAETALTELPVIRVEQDTVQDFTVKNGYQISGNLTDAQGRALDLARVSYTLEKIPSFIGLTTHTDAQGNYSLFIGEGNYNLNIALEQSVYLAKANQLTKPEYPYPNSLRFDQYYQDVSISAESDKVFDAVLPIAQLSGIVKDEQGNPLKNAKINGSVYTSLGNNRFKIVYLSGDDVSANERTDENGEFTIAMLTDTAIDLIVTPHITDIAYATTTFADVNISTDTQLPLVVANAKTISGKLTDSQGNTIDNAELSLIDKNLNRKIGDSWYTNQNGEFNISVTSGVYEISVRILKVRYDYRTGEEVETEYPAPEEVYFSPAVDNIQIQKSDSNIELNIAVPLATLSGILVDQAGTPQADIFVGVDNLHDNAFYEGLYRSYGMRHMGDYYMNQKTFTGSDGVFSFSVLLNQDLDITFESRTDGRPSAYYSGLNISQAGFVQFTLDGDEIAASFDSDSDGTFDQLDAFPFDPTETLDTDGDGIGNNADPDDDGDNVLDQDDFYPLDSERFADVGFVDGDVDGDGRADIVWRHQHSGQNWLWKMQGMDILESVPLNKINTDWQIVGLGDLNADNKTDIVWRNYQSGRNWTYLMDGTNITSSKQLNYITDLEWRIEQVADVDGDAKADIIWRHAKNGNNWLYLMDGHKITKSLPLRSVKDNEWRIVATGDVNGDGKQDLIWRHGVDGTVYIWLMNGETLSKAYILTRISLDWTIAGSGDLNGDGTDDIVWRNQSDGRNWLYTMAQGNIQRSELINVVDNEQWQIADIKDVNGDGKADLFWRNPSQNKTYFYLMDGVKIKQRGHSKTVSSSWNTIQ